MKFSKEWQVLRVSFFISWFLVCFFFYVNLDYSSNLQGDGRCKHVKLEWCLNSNINDFPLFWGPDVDGGCDAARPSGPYERCETARPLKSWTVRETLPGQKQQRWKRPPPSSPNRMRKHGVPLTSHSRSSWPSVTALPLLPDVTEQIEVSVLKPNSF